MRGLPRPNAEKIPPSRGDDGRPGRDEPTPRVPPANRRPLVPDTARPQTEPANYDHFLTYPPPLYKWRFFRVYGRLLLGLGCVWAGRRLKACLPGFPAAWGEEAGLRYGFVIPTGGPR